MRQKKNDEKARVSMKRGGERKSLIRNRKSSISREEKYCKISCKTKVVVRIGNFAAVETNNSLL